MALMESDHSRLAWAQQQTSLVMNALWPFQVTSRSPAQSFVFEYCIVTFLPSQVHERPASEHGDLSYMVTMSLAFKPLRDAMIATASLTIPAAIESEPDLPVALYCSAVKAIHQGIYNQSFTGQEDCLLATLLWLCMFENSRLDQWSRCDVHVRALATVLQLRQPLDHSATDPSRIAFERFCIEGFVYQATSSVFFDPSLGSTARMDHFIDKFRFCFTRILPLPSSLSNHVEQRFPAPRSPLLGAPPEVFLMLMQAMMLTRNAQMLEPATVSGVWEQYQTLATWEEQVMMEESSFDGPFSSGRLYGHATKLLLLRCLEEAHFGKLPASQQSKVQKTVRQALDVLQCQILRFPFGKYYLLPLAVIGSVVTRESDKHLIREKLGMIEQRNKSCLVVLVKSSLEGIWQRSQASLDVNLQGVSTILDEEQLHKTTASLWPEDFRSTRRL